jgi:hypothetical protein
MIDIAVGEQTYIDALDTPITLFSMGNETEVYRTDDLTSVVKVKNDLAGDRRSALMHAWIMRLAAQQFAECLGPEHSIANDYAIARDNEGKVQVLVVQPFVQHARALYRVDYAALPRAERHKVAQQLRLIIKRSLSFYRETGRMPDLYGRSSTSAAERKRLNKPWMLPRRLWSFIVQRNLLRAHNLMLTDAPESRVVLVDYDLVRRSWLYRKVYYSVRLLLFGRDWLLIWWMERGGTVPGSA